MELSLPQSSTPPLPQHCQPQISSIRIKLQFEKHGILSSKQSENFLSASWFLLRPQLRCISDLAADIVSSFHLHISCPQGIILRMENFTLPPSQSIGLLKDKDIVNVVKKVTSGHLMDERFKHETSSSLGGFDIGSHGVKLYAPDEFEKETGGYESEKEEEAQTTKCDNTIRASKKKKRKLIEFQRDTDVTPLKSKKKKRKHTASERDDEQDRDFKLEVIPYGVDNFPQKVKKTKKKKRIACCNEKNGVLESPQEKNVTINESPKTQRRENKTKWLVEVKENVGNGAAGLIEIDQTNRQKDVTEDSHSTSSMSEKLPDGQGTLEEAKSVKKFSRSTLRKRAKRRWKREQKQMLEANAEARGNNQSSFVSAEKIDEDGDAEEEQLPIVVKPGHIRFKHLDGDDDENGHTQQNNISINWDGEMSKRKGQSWGQEKSRRGSRSQIEYNETESSASQVMEKSESQVIQYETLPCLKRSLQKGDVIAYRMLELTANLCPGVSEFQVGEVVEVDTVSGMLKLAEIPANSLKPACDGVSRTEYHGEILELVFADLVEVRLVEGSLCAAQNNSLELEATPTFNPMIDSVMFFSADHMEVESGVNAQTSSMNDAQAFDEVGAIALSKPKSPLHDTMSVAWKEISETIEKRKEQLARGETKKQDKSRDGCELTGEDTAKKTATSRQNRTWIRRAGGLGSTMALLRSQMS